MHAAFQQRAHIRMAARDFFIIPHFAPHFRERQKRQQLGSQFRAHAWPPIGAAAKAAVWRAVAARM
jgi:hypothetical protein